MVRVLVIRHAVAFERDRRRWPDDGKRPLTARGIQKFRKSARGLARLTQPPEHVLTSPLVRAVQTAEILTAVSGWPAALETARLAPGQTTQQALALVGEHSADCLALVGHEPDLSRFVAIAIGGTASRTSIALKKGGVACLEFGRAVRPGGAQLMWLATPRLLRALGRASRS